MTTKQIRIMFTEEEATRIDEERGALSRPMWAKQALLPLLNGAWTELPKRAVRDSGHQEVRVAVLLTLTEASALDEARGTIAAGSWVRDVLVRGFDLDQPRKRA